MNVWAKFDNFCFRVVQPISVQGKMPSLKARAKSQWEVEVGILADYDE